MGYQTMHGIIVEITTGMDAVKIMKRGEQRYDTRACEEHPERASQNVLNGGYNDG